MKIKKVRTYLLGVVTAMAVGAFLAPGAQADGFTAEQAANGKAKFEQNCSGCHRADLTGGGGFPALTGDRFMGSWGSKTSSDLFNFISRRMPFDRPGQLAEEDYVVIIAYWLSVHGHAPGNQSLTSGSGVVLQP